MNAYNVNIDGKLKIEDITRTKLIKEFNVHNRDLRPIFLSQQISTLLVRENCVILNLGAVKMIIGVNNAYVFNVDNKHVSEILLKEIKLKIPQDLDKTNTPFEFIILEIALNDRLNQLDSEYDDIEKKINNLLEILKTDFGDEVLERLLSIKKRFSQIETRVQETQNSVSEILEDDQELENICLSVKSTETIDEIESILENYYEQVADIHHRIMELKENIDDTQEIITLKLASIRNTIIRFDLMIGTLTTFFGLGAVITGLYGMNVKNFSEGSDNAFLNIAITIIFMFGLFLFITWWYLKKKRILR